MLRWALAITFISSSTAAADSAPKWLAENPDGSVSGISPALDAKLSKDLKASEADTRHPGDATPGAGCRRGLMTNVVVSYSCSRARDKFERADMNVWHSSYVVNGDKLVELTLEDFIVTWDDKTGAWNTLKGTNPFTGNAPCTRPSQNGPILLTKKGLEMFESKGAHDGCFFAWKDLQPLLKPGTRATKVITAVMAGTLIGGPATEDLTPTPVPTPRSTPGAPIKLIASEDAIGDDPATVRFVAATQQLSAEILRQYLVDTKLLGRMQREWAPPAMAGVLHDDTGCMVGFATSAIVSWMCREREDKYTAAERRAAAYLIENGKLRKLATADIFAPRADLDKEIAALPTESDVGFYKCVIDAWYGWFPAPSGLRGFSSDGDVGCVVTWPMVRALLKPGSVVEQLARATYADNVPELPVETTAGWAKEPRFVAEGADAVLDKSTNLVWAANDNGADLNADAAEAYAKAYRGSGKADWRLPTEEELEMLVDPALSHRESKDCTKGKSSYTLTPLIHVSCGLVWSSTAVKTRKTPSAVGMGLISGTPRVSARTEKKNYRALVVRKN